MNNEVASDEPGIRRDDSFIDTVSRFNPMIVQWIKSLLLHCDRTLNTIVPTYLV